MDPANRILAAEIAREEQRIRDYDPSIWLFFNPRIQRWIVCEDRRATSDRTNPFRPPDSDLIGIEGVGELTPFNALFKCEFSDGNPFPPLADIVIPVLKFEHPKAGEKDPQGVVKRMMEGERYRKEMVKQQAIERFREDRKMLTRKHFQLK